MIEAGTDIPGAPVNKPMRNTSNPAPMVHMGQAKLTLSHSRIDGTCRLITNQAPIRINSTPRKRLVRFCRIAILLFQEDDLEYIQSHYTRIPSLSFREFIDQEC